MADQPFMSGVSGMQDVKALLDLTSEASLNMAEHMNKAGLTFENMNEHIQKTADDMTKMVNSLATYNTIMNGITQSVQNLVSSNNQVTGSINDQITAMDKVLQRQDQQLQKSEQKRQADNAEAERIKSESAHKQSIASTANWIEHPMSSGQSALMGAVPEMAILAAGAAMAKGMFDTYRGYEKIAAAGGSDMGTAFGGAGNIGRFSIESKINSFMGYASESESGNAMSMLIKSGLRGDELIKTFNGLGEAAEKAGMSLGELTKIVGVLSRRYEEEPGAAGQVKKGTEYATELAQSKGFDTKEFVQAMSEMMSSRQYLESNRELLKGGGRGAMAGTLFDVTTGKSSYGEMAQQPVQLMMKDIADYLATIQKYVYEGHFTQPQLNGAVTEGIVKGKSWDQITEDLKHLVDVSNVGGDKAEVTLENRNKLEQSYLPLVANKITAENEATKMMSGAFVEGLKSGAYSLETLNKVLPVLTSEFHKSPEQITSFAENFDSMGKRIHIAGSEIAGNVIAISKGLVALGIEPSKALETGKSIMSDNIAKLINEGKLNTGQLNDIMKTHMDVFGESSDTAHKKLDYLANSVERAGLRMVELTDFLNSNAQALRRFGISEDSATEAHNHFTKFLHEGTVSGQAFLEILKGPAGASEGVQAMAYEQAVSKGGLIGAIAKQSGGPIGFMTMLQDVNSAVSGGDSSATQALRNFRSQMGGDNDQSFYKNLQGQLFSTIQGVSGNILGSVGGNDMNSWNSRAMLTRMAPGLGYNISDTYGQGNEAAGKMLLDHSANFGVGVDKFTSAAQDIKDAASIMKSIASGHNVSVPPSPRKNASVTPQPAQPSSSPIQYSQAYNYSK